MTKIPHQFLIVAPPYQNRSGGVMTLHDLCDAINQCGHQASIAFMHNGSSTLQNFEYAYSNNPELYKPNGCYHQLNLENINDEVLDILQHGTVIYPDLIRENPLGGKRQIRFIMYDNKMSYKDNYIIAHSKIFYSSYNFSLPNPFTDPRIHDINTKNWSERTLNLTYIGKGPNHIDCFRIPNTLLVERDWPRDKEQLGLLLRQCKYFFTWDCVSATNIDAMLCGAVPILLHEKQMPISLINASEFGSFPKIEFNFDSSGNVILESITQKLSNHINDCIKNMKEQTARLNSSYISRVGQFLNDYMIYLSKK